MIRDHAAVILAAGGSGRLGRPKQLLRRDGETLVHRAVRSAAATHPMQLIAVLGAYREEVMVAISDLPCTTVFNTGWESGLASSLVCAAAAVAPDCESVLVLGCDQPALDAAHLGTLLEAAEHSPQYCAASFYAGLRGMPALLPAAWLRRLDPLGGLGLRSRLRSLEADALGCVVNEALAIDIDTEADLACATAIGLIDRAL